MQIQPISYSNYNSYNNYNGKVNFGAKGIDKVAKAAGKYDSLHFLDLYYKVGNAFGMANTKVPEIAHEGKKFRPANWSEQLLSELEYKGKKYVIKYFPGKMVDHSYEAHYYKIFTTTPDEVYNVSIRNHRLEGTFYNIEHYPGTGSQYYGSCGYLKCGEPKDNQYTSFVKNLFKAFLEQ